MSHPLKSTTATIGLTITLAGLIAVGLAPRQAVAADPLGAGAGTVYRLNPGTSYEEGCFPPCLCPILVQGDLRGTFRLSYEGFVGAVDAYSVTDVNWILPQQNSELRITGSGRYEIGSPDPLTVLQHRMQLDLKIGNEPVQHFDSGWVMVEQTSGINITVSINGMFCWDIAIGIDASAVPVDEIQPYTLVAGSTFQRGCYDPCDCPLGPELPMAGTFGLVPIGGSAFASEFAVVDVDWRIIADSATEAFPVSGCGKYFIGGDFVLQQRLGLDLIVANEPRTHFDSGLVPVVAQFPKIDVVVSMNNMECFDTVMHVVAEPRPVDVCGGIAGLPCADGEFCKLPPGKCCCDFFGVCVPIPGACPDVWEPVCGCDGITYGNECEADAAGVSVAHPGECPSGACCMPNSVGLPPCRIATRAECENAGGAYQGDDTTCPTDGTTPCSAPTGACCVLDAAGTFFCFEGTEAGCLAEGGNFQGPGTTCPPPGAIPCEPPIGACCTPNSAGLPPCQMVTRAMCADMGGAYQGDGSTCPPDPTVPCGPPRGACCLAGTPGNPTTPFCIEATEEGCLAEGGAYQGDGTTCPADGTVPCNPPVGACCVFDPNGVFFCFEGTELHCIAEGGQFQGPGTVCPADGSIPCDVPFGACCFQNGSCAELPVDICLAEGGEPLPGASCNLVDCGGPPIGACCLGTATDPNNVCMEVSEPECVAVGGAFQGPGTRCPVDPSLPCGIPTGACCTHDATGSLFSCVEVSEPRCREVGGAYQGNGTTCPADPTAACGVPCNVLCPAGYDCFAGCGVLVQGVECVLFQAESGGLYLLDNLGGFGVGDRVFVAGCVTPQCTTVCQQGDGCISANVIERCGRVCGGDTGLDCAAATEFCKYPAGVCGDPAVTGVCTPRPDACPEIYAPVCGCDGVTYGNECQADAAGVSVAHVGECPVACAAKRVLSNPDLSYCPTVTNNVRILLDLPATTSAIGIEDTPPAGWTVSNISNGGTYDAVNHKVKWGPLFPPFPAEVSYDTTPTVAGSLMCFNGTISIDGVNEAICGDECLDPCCPDMAADAPQASCPQCPVGDCNSCATCGDGQVALCEVIGYACAWMMGCNDDLAGMTRAAFVWRNGECYCWGEADQNWYPADCPGPGSGCCGQARSSGQSAAGAAPAGAAVGHVRPMFAGRTGAARGMYQVSVTVDAPAGTSAMALELQVPLGWNITDISDGGTLDEVYRKVKWGPFFENQSRTVSFKVRPFKEALKKMTRGERGARPASSFSITGTVSFDGVNQPITIN